MITEHIKLTVQQFIEIFKFTFIINYFNFDNKLINKHFDWECQL